MRGFLASLGITHRVGRETCLLGVNQFRGVCVQVCVMGLRKSLFVGAVGAAIVAISGARAEAQDARQIVQQAVNAELAANRDDHSRWRYLKHADGGECMVVVETDNGAISRHLADGGRPASEYTLHEDDEQIQKFIHDPGMQAKQKRDGAHDEKSATELLHLLPTAFDWKIQSESGDTITLTFQPDPKFDPPDMEARVMARWKAR